MKYSPLFTALITFSLIACGQKPAETPVATPATAPTPQAAATPAATSASSLPLGHVPIGAAKMAPVAAEPMLTQKAQVLSATNVAPYTYLEVMQDNKTRWIATTATTAATAKKGDTIQFDDGTLMTNFTSKVLNRTFPSIALVGRVIVANENASK